MNRQTNTLQCENGATAFLEAHRAIVGAGDSPDPTGKAWRAFTLDTPSEAAAGAFLRRYGRPPEFVFESRGLLLAGPIPAEVTL